MTLIEEADAFLEATADIRDLRNKLQELREEERVLEERLRRRLDEVAARRAAPGTLPVPMLTFIPDPVRSRTGSTVERVLGVLRSNPTIEYSAMDIAKVLGVTDENDINAMRSALSRLNKDGVIHRRSFGKYAMTPAPPGQLMVGGDKAS